ncbi:hypothetical protein [Protaetiibacter mangrovi]|uniref:PH domain-containing protein n=1 Tax=Protaetiibacter mangrovi TaxID=2970926 RepID=A0ABT1ZIL4_9MICO|nr:hypothetical protein [Protaetiibacter mangrovi]MCS0500425.1 hypothetical protein [Protaetiibacter mangrovi]TPX02888.1 hypothetical protein FJ656_20060 [Schumannella luteola]
MTDAAPAEPRTFHPSWPAFHRRMLMRFLWLAPLLVFALVIAAWPSIGLALVVLGTGILLAGLGLLVYFARSRVTVESGELRIRGPLRTRRWPLHAVATLVFVPLPGARRATLYGVSPALERMFSLSAELWDEADLEALAGAIGASVVRAPAGLAPLELQERYPGTVGWTTTHPWLVVLLLTGGAMIVMIAVAVVVAAVLIATGQVPMPSPS